MHELPVTESILEIVLRHAKQNHVKQVVSITLEVGKLSDLENQWLQHYFDYLSKDTPAAGAELKIERVAAVLECKKCGNQFEIDKDQLGLKDCPNCGASEGFALISGRQYHIREMEAI